MKLCYILIILALLLVFHPVQAQAYIDPGAGSMILQALAAVAIGAGVMYKQVISKVMDKWAYENKVTLDFSRPGKPTDNAFIESFNGSFRDECLNANWFLSLDDARQKIEDWRQSYNSYRPHSSLGYLTPDEFAEKHNQMLEISSYECPALG